MRPTSCRHRIVVLQHPREATQTFGTARILKEVLPQTELHVGARFTADEAARLLADPLPPLLLYPGPLAEVLHPESASEPRTLIAIDATWTTARQMFAANAWLHALPARRLKLNRESVYTLRAQPSAESLCTVEAVAEAVALLDGDDVVRAALMAPLQAMTGLQEASRAAGSSAALTDRARLVRDGYLPEP